MNNTLQKMRASKLWDILAEKAKLQSRLTYQELEVLSGVHKRVLKFPLELIQQLCIENSYPALTTLVVQKASGKPGAGNGVNESDLESETAKVFGFDWVSLANPFASTNSELDLRSLFKRVRDEWVGYTALKKTSKDHLVHDLVVKTIPHKLLTLTLENGRFKSIGSTGQGNITTTPWIATLDLHVTKSAQDGYYLVYLFSADLRNLVLAVCFGATAFQSQFGTGKKLSTALQDAVQAMRTTSSNLVRNLDSDIADRVSQVRPELNTSSNSPSLKTYEECCIYSLTYDLSELPDESYLVRDYLNFLDLYSSMTQSLVLPEPDSFVLESIEEGHQEIAEVKQFEVRKFVKGATLSNGNGQSISPRRSKNSDAVGKLGEELVVKWERSKLVAAGRSDLAKLVVWHREDPKNRTPGWDITSYETDGSEIYIEVKSSTQKSIKDIELTPNEWAQASAYKETGKYRIYLVNNILAKPILETVVDPYSLVSENVFELTVSNYLLRLGSSI